MGATMDELRKELSMAYNAYFAAISRLERVHAARMGSALPALAKVRETKNNVIVAEHKLVAKLRIDGMEAV